MHRNIAGCVALAAVVLPSLLACTGDSGALQEASHTARDSAAIRIVQNHSPAWPEGSGWTIGLEPALLIGVAEGPAEHMLFGASDALRMSDGRIAVVNGGSQEVRFYAPDGQYLSSVGGKGEGPGEFQMPWRAQRIQGDTLVVWDMGYPGNLNWFDEEGAFLHRTPIDRARLAESLQGWFAEGGELLPDGTFLHHMFDQRNPNMDRIGPYRSERAWIRATVDGSRVDTIGFFPGSEQFGYAYEGRTHSNGLMFGGDTYVTGGGAPLRFFVADNGRYEIQVLSEDGRLEGLIRRTSEPIPVTPEDIQESRDQYRQFLEQVPEAQRGRFEAYLDVVEYPSTKPVLGPMHVDREGYLWVFEPRRGEGDSRIAVFDPDGVWLGVVALPGWLRVTEIGSDYVLGSRRDELGVESVVMYALDRI